MRFCFILEERYVHKPMPMAVADQLQMWGHEINVLQPYAAVTSLTDLSLTKYDAYVLKTVSEGPGLTILEAAEAVGIPTINNSRAIRLVRDKAVAVAYAQSRELPVPVTYFVGHPRALVKVPYNIYPVVVKPSNGTSLQDIHLVYAPEDMPQITDKLDQHSYYLAMHYVENTGYDIKLYVTGQEVHAISKSSPLHGTVTEQEIQVTPEMLKIARRVGQVFGLDLYGVDVLETAEGLVLVDINDFPSFYGVPRKVTDIAEYILHAAYRARRERDRHDLRSLPMRQKTRTLGRQEPRLLPADPNKFSLQIKQMLMNQE
jgi:ribosomal protein S6--L-glutamate ligase